MNASHRNIGLTPNNATLAAIVREDFVVKNQKHESRVAYEQLFQTAASAAVVTV